MDRMKKGIFAVAVTGLLLSSNFNAFADEPAFVDINKVANTYTKAQSLANEIKTKDAEIRLFATNAQKEVAALKNPDDQKKLEDKYNKELQRRVDLFRQDQLTKINNIESNVAAAIKTVAEKRKLGTILRKDSIIFGGLDVTDDVLSVLNQK